LTLISNEEFTFYTLIQKPNGLIDSICGFYFQNYELQYKSEIEKLNKVGEPIWKIKYTPTEIGAFSFVFYIVVKGKKYKSEKYTFQVTDSNNNGFIRKANNNLVFDSNKPYFATGISIAWVDKYNIIKEYEYYFKKLKKSNCNYSRIWLVEWNIPIEWTNNGLALGDVNGLGWYSQENSWKLDKIIELAKENGIYLLITLGNYSDFMIEKGLWNEDKWNSNPYNIENGGVCNLPEDFWSNEKAIDYYKNKLDYIISRWGYSQNILAFELWNELSTPIEWTNKICDYIKLIDPNNHLITTSISYIENPKNKLIDSLRWSIPNIDFTQSHIYGNGDIINLPKHIGLRNIQMIDKYKKPHLIAEFGIDYLSSDEKYDTNGAGVQLHNVLWTSLMTNSFGVGMSHWTEYIDEHNLYDKFHPLLVFIKDINWVDNNFKKLDFIVNTNKNTKLILIPNGGWGHVANYPLKIYNDGNASDLINRYVHGTSKSNESYYFIPELLVNYPENGNFKIDINKVSQNVKIKVLIDNEIVLEKQYKELTEEENRNTPNNNLIGNNSNYEYGFIEIPVSVGEHIIRIENSGKDWLEIKEIELGNYTPEIEVYGLKGNKLTIGWIRNINNNWYNKMKSRLINPIENVQLKINGFSEGKYIIQLWDTNSGMINQELIQYSQAGDLNISIPFLDGDVAFKVIPLYK